MFSSVMSLIHNLGTFKKVIAHSISDVSDTMIKYILYEMSPLLHKIFDS